MCNCPDNSTLPLALILATTPLEVSLLFWNVHKKDLKHSVVRMVQGHGINILILAEFDEKQNANELLAALNEPPRLPEENEFRLLVPAIQPHVQAAMFNLHIFTRLPLEAWALQTMRNRYAVWTISLTGRRQFILATTHFPAIQQDQGDKQRESAAALRRDIEHAEWQAQDKDPLCIIMGDFNANPFDPGIAAVYGLNATHLKNIAQTGVRNSNGRSHPYFFNPMWRFLGGEPWGTYFNDKLSNPVRYDWFILDQVLVRPNVIPLFDLRDEPDLKILTSDGIVDFDLSSSRPSRERESVSDHLPLYFRFDLPPQTDAKPLPEQENTHE